MPVNGVVSRRVQVPAKSTRGRTIPGSWNAGLCQLLDMGITNQTQVPCKGRECSSPLSHLASPCLFFYKGYDSK